MELVFSRDEFPFLKIFTVHPLSSLLSLTLSPLSSLLSPMWQKLPYICNNFFHYSNLRITFLNYCTIEKSPTNEVHILKPMCVVHLLVYFIYFFNNCFFSR